MQLTIAALVMLVGLLVYALSNNAKVAELGRIMFWTGLAISLLAVGGQGVRLP